MDFLSPDPPIKLNDPNWPIRTYKPQYPPTYVGGGEIINSIVGDGCYIQGGKVVNSILSPGVTVEPEAEIEESIILEGAIIRRGARVFKSIVDKQAIIPANFSVGLDLEKDRSYFKISPLGIRTIPKGWRLE